MHFFFFFNELCPSFNCVFFIFYQAPHSRALAPTCSALFMCLQCNLLKTMWEKEKLLVTSNVSFSHSIFYPFREISSLFSSNSYCRLQTFSVWKCPKFVILEKVNTLLHNLVILGCLFVHSCNSEHKVGHFYSKLCCRTPTNLCKICVMKVGYDSHIALKAISCQIYTASHYIYRCA